MLAMTSAAVAVFLATDGPIFRIAHGLPTVVDSTAMSDFYQFPGASGVLHLYTVKLYHNVDKHGGVKAITVRAVEPRLFAGKLVFSDPPVASNSYTAATPKPVAALPGIGWLKCRQDFPGATKVSIKGHVQVVVEYNDGTRLDSGPWLKPLFVP